MAIHAVVQVTKKPVRVSTNALSTAVVTTNPVTLRSDAVLIEGGAGGINELTELIDVDVSFEEDGSVLQYNAGTDTYQVKPLVLDSIPLNFDGGVF